MSGDRSGPASSPGGRPLSPGGRAAASSPVARPGPAGAAERRFRLVVLGDVMIEARADLPGVRFADVAADRLAYAPARAVVAGTAVNMARCAAGYFRRVAVLGKIGDDAFTPVIRRELRRIGVRDLLCVEPGAANGVAVMLREGPSRPRTAGAGRTGGARTGGAGCGCWWWTTTARAAA
ncbi:PfkB family carbohydrate kinase [Actinomadura keratinilytica]|uniref:PfkB family carbohydrate kinase n=1 Tax=Actinomadura keratinilytica TaxID=547461 RepID=UPI0036127844